MDLRTAVLEANAACSAFSAACAVAGYRNRWDWDPRKDRNPALLAARDAHHAAGARMQAAFAASRNANRNPETLP